MSAVEQLAEQTPVGHDPMREACAKVDALNLDLGSLGCKLNGSCNQNDLTYGGKQAAAFTEQAIVDPSKIMV